MNWGLTAQTLKERLAKGYVKAVFSGRAKKKVTIYYLTSGLIRNIHDKKIQVIGTETSGAAVVKYTAGKDRIQRPNGLSTLTTHNPTAAT